MICLKAGCNISKTVSEKTVPSHSILGGEKTSVIELAEVFKPTEGGFGFGAPGRATKQG